MPKPADTEPKAHKLQASAEDYTFFVVSELIGIKGRSHSDVTAFIIKDWVGDHQEELAKYGIDVAAWRKKAGR